MIKKLIFLTAILNVLVFLTPACNTDQCKDIDCGENGTCFEGTCVCNDGYEGANCETTWASKFVGSYTGSDVCMGQTFNLNQPAVISERTASQVRIFNFGGFLSTVDFDINPSNPDQLSLNATDLGGRDFTGTATLSGNTLSGNYTVTFDDGTSESCTFTYTK